ncbi:MAG: hypothetical protein NZ602_00290 [Thermoguttaceae bacterium]|nr:hypothetical protein [Thermoguttaceae bacterium]MDW8038619.1 hypothetical protein [Thermoguttaceae bacterium]
MLQKLQNLDRRWIFLLMLLAVGCPMLADWPLPEKPTGLVRQTFEMIDRLPAGSKILLSWDWDPSAEGELGPMANAFVRHCCEKKHKMVFIALWPVGQQLIDDTIRQIIHTDYPQLVYGRDYVNLGFKPGNEGVIKVLLTDLRQLYTTDALGTNIEKIPVMRGVNTVRDFDLVISVSGGYPGIKEWVQYASAAYPNQIRLIGGTTGVSAPLLYPYIPDQLQGLLGAIKGAAEYEQLLLEKYPPLHNEDRGKYQLALRRMGPQLVAHLLMIGLIVLGNILYFAARRAQRT